MASDHPDFMRLELGKRIESFRQSFSEWIGMPLFGLFLIAIGCFFVWFSSKVYSPEVWNGKFNDPVGIWGMRRILAPCMALFAGFGVALCYNWLTTGNDQLDLYEQGAAVISEGKLSVVQWSEMLEIIEIDIRHRLRPNAVSVAIKVLDRPIYSYVAHLANGGEFAFSPCCEVQTPRLKQLLRHYADYFQWAWETEVRCQ